MSLTLPFTLTGWLLFAALIALTAGIALSFSPIMTYIKAYAHGKVFDVLRTYTHNYVVALEQDPTLKGLASEEKKQRAVIWLVLKAEELHIPLTEAEASNLVEEAVYLVKNVALKSLHKTLDNAANPILIAPPTS